jgi:two-component system nitrogen regulation response regulator GlnG
MMRRIAVLGREDLIDAEAARAMLGDLAAGPAPLSSPDVESAVRARLAMLERENPASLDDGTLYDRLIAEVERPLIEATLARHGGNQLRAARALGINRNTLRKRLDTLGIGRLASRPDEA